MIPVKSMTEEEIAGVAEAFADYSYADGEHGLICLFSKREALIAYLRTMVRAGLKAGMVYTNGPDREGFIIITDTTKPMPLGPTLMMFKGMIRALGFRGFQNFIKHCQSGGGSIEMKFRREKRQFIQISKIRHGSFRLRL